MDRGQSALPATPATVAEFLRDQSKSAAAATISRRRAAIAKIHRLMPFDSPVSDEEVSLAARAVFREKGRRQKQALGLTCPLKQKIVDACASDLYGLRDRALISVGYDTLCRRSELVQHRIEDLVTRPDGSATILVRKSKTDQLSNGRLVYLSADTFKYVQLWLAAVDLRAGPIFRPIYAAGVSEDALRSHAVSRVIKRRATDAGIDPGQVRRLTGHSMRVGAAQDMAAAGIELTALMHVGGWKSPEMVMRYIEHMDVAKSGMARLYDRRSTAPHIEANKDQPIGNPR